VLKFSGAGWGGGRRTLLINEKGRAGNGKKRKHTKKVNNSKAESLAGEDG